MKLPRFSYEDVDQDHPLAFPLALDVLPYWITTKTSTIFL